VSMGRFQAVLDKAQQAVDHLPPLAGGTRGTRQSVAGNDAAQGLDERKSSPAQPHFQYAAVRCPRTITMASESATSLASTIPKPADPGASLGPYAHRTPRRTGRESPRDCHATSPWGASGSIVSQHRYNSSPKTIDPHASFASRGDLDYGSLFSVDARLDRVGLPTRLFRA
jgi:hypothetical protein